MTISGIGDLAQTILFRQQAGALKKAVQTASQELTTGQTADRVQHRGGDTGPVLALESTLSRLAAFTRAGADAALMATRMQTALATVQDLVSGFATSLLNTGLIAEQQTLSALAEDAGQRLDATIRTLNQRSGDRAMFAGIETAGPALAEASVFLDAVEAAVAASGATDADAIAIAISDWFDDPTGFATSGYLGGAPLSPFQLSPSESGEISMTAADPALRDTLKALTTAALLGRGIPADPVEAASLARIAGGNLLQSDSDRTELAARIGLVEGRIESAMARNIAETAGLKMVLADLLAIDPYEAATRLEASQGQLETLFALTARLSRLSLVDFLR
ncbi:MAG: flagellin [Pseudorhodobacter sp.]